MSITEYLQIQGYVDKERELFTSYESNHFIKKYDDICDENVENKKKIKIIKNIINLIIGYFNKDKNKLLFLFLFHLISTPYGVSLLQENANFRLVVFDKYNEILESEQNDINFIVELEKVRI